MKKQTTALIAITITLLLFKGCVFAQQFKVDLKVNTLSKEVIYDIQTVTLDVLNKLITITYSNDLIRRFVIVNTNISINEMQFICRSNGGTFEFTFMSTAPTKCYIFCESNSDNYKLYTNK